MNQRNSAHRRRGRTRFGSAFSQLRSQYFARAGESAVRYGIGFDRVVEHLWGARGRGLVIPVSLIVYIDDLVHAVALVDHNETAWTDLREIYERWLIRKFRNRLPYTEALLEVRGLLSELRREHTEGADGIDSLRCYLGLVPMQLWLVERLEQRLAAHNTDQTPLQPLEEPALEPQDIEVFPFRQPGAVIG